MWVTYTPDDPATSGDGGRWEFDPARVLGQHAEMIERRYGSTWEKFCADVARGSMRARRVLLWYFRMKEHPGYRLEDLPDFYTGELVVSFSVKELTELRANVEKADWDSDAEREQALVSVDQLLSEAIDEEERERRDLANDPEAGANVGKAPSLNDESSTGLSLRRLRESSRGSGDT